MASNGNQSETGVTADATDTGTVLDTSEDDDEERDSIEWDRVRKAATTRGSLNWQRIVRALRGAESDGDWNLSWFLPPLLLTLLASPIIPSLVPSWVFGSTDDVLLFVILVVSMIGLQTAHRLQAYYSEDEQVVVEELRAAYAADDMAFSEFKAKIDRVLEGDTAAAEAGDDATATPDDTPAGEPVAILKHRFASGEIDAEEYRYRMEMLGESVPDVARGGEDDGGADRGGEDVIRESGDEEAVAETE
jgi:uncharacterized membrane protein